MFFPAYITTAYSEIACPARQEYLLVPSFKGGGETYETYYPELAERRVAVHAHNLALNNPYFFLFIKPSAVLQAI